MHYFLIILILLLSSPLLPYPLLSSPHLQLGDFIVALGAPLLLDAASFVDVPTSVVPVIKGHINRPLAVTVLRPVTASEGLREHPTGGGAMLLPRCNPEDLEGATTLSLALTPGAWAGGGMLGCLISPVLLPETAAAAAGGEEKEEGEEERDGQGASKGGRSCRVEFIRSPYHDVFNFGNGDGSGSSSSDGGEVGGSGGGGAEKASSSTSMLAGAASSMAAASMERPDVAIAFNSGVADYRNEWGPTMETVVRAGIPLATTSYHTREALFDKRTITLCFGGEALPGSPGGSSASASGSGDGSGDGSYPQENPWRSLLPHPDPLFPGEVYHSNSYLSVYSNRHGERAGRAVKRSKVEG